MESITTEEHLLKAKRHLYCNGQKTESVYETITEFPFKSEDERVEDNPEDSQKTEKKKLYLGYFEEKIVWGNALGFLFMHIVGSYGAYLAFFQSKLTTLIWVVSISVLSGLGVTVGAHRLFSHRSFKVKLGVKLFFLICHTIAGQNCLYIWVRDHRQHHRYSDTDADPHNARRGFFFSHVGWLMMRKKDEVKEKGKTMDLSDLEADPWIMFQKDYYKTLYFIFAIIIPMFVPWYFLGEGFIRCFVIMVLARYVVTLNITWLVNSAAHFIGTKPYNKNIIPVECEIVSFCTMGEGWHNYHHAFPWDYRAAEFGAKWDGSTRLIDWMARKGWAYDLKQASETLIRKVVLDHGDGSHKLWGGHIHEEMKEEDFCEITHRLEDK